MKNKLKIISGTANIPLAEEIAKKLKVKLTPTEIKRFRDGEIYARVLESVRGSDVVVVQPTSPDANLNLMELLILVDALVRASPERITAVVPYYGYSRQDKKLIAREPITAKLVANMLKVAGIERVITLDLHVAQIQGFFDMPSDNLEFLPFFADYILDKKLGDVVVVSPDAGGVMRARRFAKLIDASLAIIDKRRPQPGEAKVMNIIGDVEGKTVVMIDDMIDSAGTISEAARAVLEKGATDVYVCATHALFSDPATERLSKAPIKEVIVTNTVDIPEEKRLDKIKVLSAAPLIAETIRRNNRGEPMGIFYDELYSMIEKKRDKK